MALSVTSLVTLQSNPAEGVGNPDWHRVLETLLPEIRERTDLNFITVTPVEGLRYQGDLYGLFQLKGVPAKYHWLTMRMNEYNNPVDYDGVRISFVAPPYGFVDDQYRIFSTLFRKNV